MLGRRSQISSSCLHPIETADGYCDAIDAFLARVPTTGGIERTTCTQPAKEQVREAIVEEPACMAGRPPSGIPAMPDPKEAGQVAAARGICGSRSMAVRGAVMQAIEKALDPHDILNRGKLAPRHMSGKSDREGGT